LENGYNMDARKKIHETIKDAENSSNKELQFALEFLGQDFEHTKSAIIKLTKHLDTVEESYNKVLKEYSKRTNARI